MWLRLLAGLAAMSLSAPAVATAALQWQSPETLPSAPTRISLGPDGVGLLFGFPNQSGNTRLAVRPLGGPVGSPQDLPSGLDFGGSTPIVGWFSDGSALIADPTTGGVAFRTAGAGGTVGTTQMLGSGNAPAAIATVPSGEALIGLDGATVLPAGVVFRSPGPAGTVDIAHKQTFGTDPGRLIGVALDPGGGAVVVWIDGSNGGLYQAVRAPGGQSFGNPTVIPATHPFQVQMASDSSGYALLSWMGGPYGPEGFATQVTATERAPGGAFPTPTVVATEASGNLTSVLPAITSSGDALVAWDGGYQRSSCSMAAGGPGNDSNIQAFAATSHKGTWGTATGLGGGTWPGVSTIDGVASSGDTVAVAFHAINDHDAQCQPPIDESTASFIDTGTAKMSGIVLDGPVNTVSEVSNGHNQFYAAGFSAMSVNPSGGALYEYGQYNAMGVPGTFLLPREDRTGGQHTLTVSVSGSGKVTGNGINCPSVCSHGYPSGTMVALSATPTSGSGATFTGWSGACAGKGACAVTISATEAVTATFTGLVKPIVPRKLVIVAPLDPAHPEYVATCPPEVADECAMRVAAFAAFGAVPTAAGKPRKAQLLGNGSIVLKPGKHGKIKIKFTPAGKRALALGRSVRIRIKVDLRYNGKHVSFTVSTTIRAPRKPKHKHKH
jgi:hypothetical protein